MRPTFDKRHKEKPISNERIVKLWRDQFHYNSDDGGKDPYDQYAAAVDGLLKEGKLNDDRLKAIANRMPPGMEGHFISDAEIFASDICINIEDDAYITNVFGIIITGDPEKLKELETRPGFPADISASCRRCAVIPAASNIMMLQEVTRLPYALYVGAQNLYDFTAQAQEAMLGRAEIPAMKRLISSTAKESHIMIEDGGHGLRFMTGAVLMHRDNFDNDLIRQPELSAKAQQAWDKCMEELLGVDSGITVHMPLTHCEFKSKYVHIAIETIKKQEKCNAEDHVFEP